MKFFLTSITSGEAGEISRVIANDIREALIPFLLERDYGEELIDITVIYMIVSKSLGLNMSERKLFKRKTREADMRLNIDYDIFCEADMQTRRLLIVKNIIESIRILDKRAKKDFNGVQMEKDILEKLDINVEDINSLVMYVPDN